MNHTKSGFTRASYLLLLACTVLLTLSMTACKGNAIRTAETPAQKAFAVIATYAIVLEAANDLKAASSPLQESRKIALHQAGVPVVTFFRRNVAPAQRTYLAAMEEHGKTHSITSTALAALTTLTNELELRLPALTVETNAGCNEIGREAPASCLEALQETAQ